MPSQEIPPDPRRVARRLACRIATVLGPVIVVGVPVGAVAARPAPGAPASPVLAAESVTVPPAAATAPQAPAPQAPAPETRQSGLDGGVSAGCDGYRGTGADRARAWSTDPAGGPARTEVVTLTSRHPTSRSAARRELRSAEICFAAPYEFRTKRGFALTGGPAGTADFRGVLGTCGSGKTHATLPKPCVHSRKVVRVAPGWVTQIAFRAPPAP